MLRIYACYTCVQIPVKWHLLISARYNKHCKAKQAESLISIKVQATVLIR